MKNARTGLRLGVLLLAFLTLFVPFGVGARASVDCADFANPDAAQVLLDADPRAYADALDPDGDGIACNEDGEEEDAPAGDAAAYLDAVYDEVDTVSATFTTFMDTYYYAGDDSTTGDDFEAALDELTDIAAMWAAYPDGVPDFDVPAGYEDIDDAYQAFVATVGETGDAWQTYWDAPDEDDALFDAFNESFVVAQESGFELLNLVTGADEGSAASDTGEDTASDDDEDAGDADDDAAASDDDAADAGDYLDTVRTHFDQLVTSFNRFNEIIDDMEITTAEEEEIGEIYVIWADARSVAADVEAPDGYEEIHAAYLAVANGFSESYELYTAWINSESGSAEEEEALAAYEQGITELNELAITLDELLKDAGA